MEPLPTFRYHPDPIATGSVIESPVTCRACQRARGYIYNGPVYSKEALHASLCPWCVADGTAHERFRVEFTDADGIGGGLWPDAPEAVIDEVAHRTPGFDGWQQERWAVCCNDAAAFIGVAGQEEIVTRFPDAIADLRRESEELDGDWESWFASLDAAGSPTAYLFRCLHCGRHTGYSDCD